MIIVNIAGLLLIALIVWWFWLYQPAELSVSDGALFITVENGSYKPSRIKVPENQPVTLTFLRKDPSPCSATLVFSDFDVSEELLLGKSKTITLPAMQKGEYPFSCQMQMYRGTLVVG
jgi:plastocyanin domain-containing protein